MRMRLFLCVCCSVLLLCNSAFALTFDEFRSKSDELFDRKITPEVMLKIANEAIAKDAKDTVEYLAFAHAIRGHIHWLQNDMKKALAEAQLATQINPKTELGFIVLGDTYVALGNIDSGINALGQAAANVESPERKKQLQTYIDDIRLQATAIAPQQLWKDFDANEVAAEDMYKGKEIAIKGKITTITTSVTGYPQVSFAVDKFGLHKVVCEFDKDARPVVSKLQKNQQVTLAGTCQGMMLQSVFLKQCKIVE